MLPVLGDILGGLLYISAFSLVYLKKAYDHCLELGITRKELSNVIKSSLIFSVVPSLSIVVGLFVLIAVLGSVWAWWRLSVIGSLSYETMISSSIAQVLGYASSAEMLESATGRQFGVVMILMSVGMLSGFLILLPFGKKLCKSVDRSAAESGGSTWKNVLSGVFMLVMAKLNIIHPFREGNGRSTRELIRCMALEYGLHINWGNTDRETLINAAIAAVDDDMAFCDVLMQCVETKN